MAISSNSLFHFTKSKDTLIGVLSDNFKVNYCREEVYFTGKRKKKFLVPMVCFCDIPLSQIKNHITKYGFYGIGLTKDWAIRNFLNPVLYIQNNSDLAMSYLKVYDEYILKREKKVNGPLLSVNEENIVNILRYMKNNENIKEKFSDEKEWRFVPKFDLNKFPIVSLKYFDNEIKENKILNQKYDDQRLSFVPNDIKYIIVNSESEITEIVDTIRNIKGANHYLRDIELLQTRILTSEQILQDF